MILTGKKYLNKFKNKNKGNTILIKDVNQLISDIESNNWTNPTELSEIRNDADCVHSDGFYFFDISTSRIMILIEFDEGQASVVWIGSHKEYNTIFKNNKNTIKSWLLSHEWI